MTFYLHFAPFLAELAFGVNEEGAAFYAHEFPAIQHLFLDYVELAAKFFVGVGQKFEGKLLFVPELFM